MFVICAGDYTESLSIIDVSNFDMISIAPNSELFNIIPRF